jgi:uncharacterized protein (TIGR03435 family)
MRAWMTIGIALSTLGSVFGQAAKAPAFEVASVKPSQPDGGGTTIRLAPNANRVTARNATVRRLIMRSYSVADWQISGGPDWLDSERFDIDAAPEHPATSEQLYAMLRTLLADRFKLTMHRETVERALYVLSVDKNGPKLKPHESGGNDQESASTDDIKGGRRGTFNNVGMSRLALFLTIESGRAVVDKTGLEGRYDFVLDFAPTRYAVYTGAMIAPPADPGQASLLKAVKEQLGLKLEPQRGPVESLHIDSVERPGGN